MAGGYRKRIMTGRYTRRKIKKFFENSKNKIKAFFHELRRKYVKKRVKSRDFTIISNNCWAGKVYQYLDMPYLSPTVGLYFFAPDFLKFCKNLKYYLSLDLKFVPWEESKWQPHLADRRVCPVGKLDDIEIFFLHYKTPEEAKEKWERRKQRVNYDKVIFKMSKMNLCDEFVLKEFDELPVKKVIISNRKKPVYKSEVYYYSSINEGLIELVNDTDQFPSNLNLVYILEK